MKRIVLFSVLLWFNWCSLRGETQFEIVWDSVFGGTEADNPKAIARANGGYLLAGTSSSTNGTKTAPRFGSSDVWVIKIDEEGRKLWEQTYRPSFYADFSTIKSVGDGLYLLGGRSDWSMLWLIQIKESGELVWERNIESSDLESIDSLEATSGGYLLTGESSRRTLVRTDALGQIIWSRAFGNRFGTTLRAGVSGTFDGGALFGTGAVTRTT